MRKPVLLIICICLLSVSANAADDSPQKPVWLVLTTPMFEKVIKPLAQHRQDQGFETVVSTLPPEKAIASLKQKPAFILLIGDDLHGNSNQPWFVESPKRKLYRWRLDQKIEYAADFVLGDIDGDHIPDVPVGRIPAQDTKQLKQVIEKIIVYENQQPTIDDLRLPVWSGTPGYGKFLDSMTTGLLLTAIQQNMAPWIEPWVISADTVHPLCGWPFDQWKMFNEQLSAGGIVAAMIGHGWDDHFHSMRFCNLSIHYSAEHARGALSAGEPKMPLIIIACNTGRFAESKDCLAESLLFLKGGPVAAIGATTQSHPLMNYYTSVSMLQCQDGSEKRLGSLWLAAQIKAMKSRDLLMEKVLCDVEGKLEDKINIEKLHRDQFLMYALLGDPATKLHVPDQLNVKLEKQNGSWNWKVTKPDGANKLSVTFCPANQQMPPVGIKVSEETALKRFNDANKTFEFQTLRELPANQPWQGSINQQGTIRFVAAGQGRMYAAAYKLASIE